MSPIDNALQRAIESRMLQDPHLSAHGIKVGVTWGVVTLEGIVPTARVKLAAHELVASTRNCRDVVNNLVVEPAVGISDAEIQAEVRMLLDAHTRIGHGAITVKVEAGRVTLTGAVATPWEYLMAQDIAGSARGVRDVHNNLIIDREAKEDDESLRAEIMAALAEASELEGAEIEVAVSGDLIVLSGRVECPKQSHLADEIARRLRSWQLRNELTVEPVPTESEEAALSAYRDG